MIQLVQMLAAGVTDDTGAVLASGTVTFYVAGTTTLKTVYQDFEQTDPHPNPATLDAAGRLKAYAADRIKIVIQTSAGATVRTVDNVGISSSDIDASSISGAAGNGLVVSDGQIDVQVDGSTITIENDELKIPTGGITSTELADDITVTNATVTTIKVGATGATFSDSSGDVSCSAGIKPSGQAILTSPNSKTLSIAGKYAISSMVNPATNGLVMVRGTVSGASVIAGEGFTSAVNSAGDITVTFTTAFSSAPAVVMSMNTANNPATGQVRAASTTAFSVLTWISGVASTQQFSFVAIGERT